MPNAGATRKQTASQHASAMFTPSAQEQARSRAAHEEGTVGAKALEAEFLAYERKGMDLLYAWQLEHGWSGPEAPDFEALLAE